MASVRSVNRLVELTLRIVNRGSHPKCFRELRGEANSLCTIRKGFLNVPLLPIDQSSGTVCLGSVRVEVNRLRAVCLGSVRVEANGLRAVGDSLVEVAVPAMGISPTAICLGHHRIKLYGPVTVGDGLVDFAFSQVSLAPAGVRLSVFWIQTNGLGVCSDRSIKIAFVSQQIALLCCFIFWATHDEFSFSGREQPPISIPFQSRRFRGWQW